MGAQFSREGGIPTFSPPKCPAPFVSADALSCVMPCPEDKKFVRQGKEKCVYTPDKQFTVNLVTVGAAVFQGQSLEDLRKSDTQKYTEFSREKDRFERDFVTVYANIDKQQKIDDAFRDLQKAENARAESPEAYQVARTAYYMLLKGKPWISEERDRVAKAEVEPEIQKYKSAIEGITAQRQQQDKTMDVVRGVKDKVISLKDDFKYSADTLNDQLEKLKIQINMEQRGREKEKSNLWPWVDTILNILLLSALVFVAWSLFTKYRAQQSPVYTVGYNRGNAVPDML